MRAIISLLLVANLAYAVWHFYLEKPVAPSPVAPEVVSVGRVNTLVLLSELPAGMQEQELQGESAQTIPTSQVPQTETSSR